MIRSATGRPATCPAYLVGRRGDGLIDLDLLWLAAYFRFLLGQVTLVFQRPQSAVRETLSFPSRPFSPR
jgi:hypothetical protein